MEMQMASAYSPTWYVIARHSRRQDDWEMYEREKETTVDDQHMWGIWNSKETSWRQMSVMCLSDGCQWPAKQQNTRRRRDGWTAVTLNSLLCADVLLRKCSLTHAVTWLFDCCYGSWTLCTVLLFSGFGHLAQCVGGAISGWVRSCVLAADWSPCQ